jgi:hypothetical protein
VDNGGGDDQDLRRARAALCLASVDQLIERGDFSGAAQWRRVWRATEELLQTSATSAIGLH